MKKKRILVAPLNWGIGHATRCIPIINALQQEGYEPVIASDGVALKLLQKEFPHIESIELPSYNITYSKTKRGLKWKILTQTPKIYKVNFAEKKLIDIVIDKYKIDGIISDNRFGIRSKRVPSVFISHQLNVLSGSTTWFSSKMHQRIIKQFDQCWVPDFKEEPNLSGKLGHINDKKDILKLKYIGPLTRLTHENSVAEYAIMVLLSGPEPQRTLLEDILFKELKHFDGKILFVKGVVEKEQTRKVNNQFTIYNFMQTEDLQKAINASQFIISRSGYTTIMDLAALGKKAFFIPTPGQFEQEYIADRLTKDGIIMSCNQNDFSLEKLKEGRNYKGFETFKNTPNFKKLLYFFESE